MSGAPRPALRVLVVRADGVGDTILTVPLLGALRAHPSVEITVIASAAAAPLLRFGPAVDRILTVDSTRAPLRERLALARSLRRQRFDVAICVSEKWWPHVWARASGADVRIGVDPGRVQPLKSAFLPAFLTHRIPIPAQPFDPSPLHEIERYLALLAPLGLEASPALLSLSLPEAMLDPARERLRAAFAQGIAPVAVQLSRKWGSEGWPRTTVADLCVSLLDARADIGLVLLGGPDEADLASAILNRLRGRHAQRMIDPGITGLGEWAAWMAVCRVLITMDTAAAHLAAALAIPVVDVFLDHRYEHASTRWAPWKVAARKIRRASIPANATRDRLRSAEEALFNSVAGALGDLL
jgi:ADP-heptose:LPS heptosyltransferase